MSIFDRKPDLPLALPGSPQHAVNTNINSILDVITGAVPNWIGLKSGMPVPISSQGGAILKTDGASILGSVNGGVYQALALASAQTTQGVINAALAPYNMVADNVQATGSITCPAKASVPNNSTVTILDDVGSSVFEFDTSGGGVTAGHVQVLLTAAVSASDVANALANVVDATVPLAGNRARMQVIGVAGGVVSLRAIAIGAGGNTQTISASSGAFAVSGMSGGKDGTDNYPALVQLCADALAKNRTAYIPAGDYRFQFPAATAIAVGAGNFELAGDGQELTRLRFSPSGGANNNSYSNSQAALWMNFTSERIHIRDLSISGATGNMNALPAGPSGNLLYFGGSSFQYVSIERVYLTDFPILIKLDTFFGGLYKARVTASLLNSSGDCILASDTSGTTVGSQPWLIIDGGTECGGYDSNVPDGATGGRGHPLYLAEGLNLIIDGYRSTGNLYNNGFHYHRNTTNSTTGGGITHISNASFSGPCIVIAITGLAREKWSNCYFEVPSGANGIQVRAAGAEFHGCEFHGLTGAQIAITGITNTARGPVRVVGGTMSGSFATCANEGSTGANAKELAYIGTRFEQTSGACVTNNAADSQRVSLKDCFFPSTFSAAIINAECGEYWVEHCHFEAGFNSGVSLTTAAGACTIHWINNSASDSTVFNSIGAGVVVDLDGNSTVAVSTSAVLQPYQNVALCDSSGGAIAPVLPAAASIPAGRRVTVADSKGSATSHHITVTAAGADQIYGGGSIGTTYPINVGGGSVQLMSDGVSKWIQV